MAYEEVRFQAPSPRLKPWTVRIGDEAENDFQNLNASEKSA